MNEAPLTSVPWTIIGHTEQFSELKKSVSKLVDDIASNNIDSNISSLFSNVFSSFGFKRTEATALNLRGNQYADTSLDDYLSLIATDLVDAGCIDEVRIMDVLSVFEDYGDLFKGDIS